MKRLITLCMAALACITAASAASTCQINFDYGAQQDQNYTVTIPSEVNMTGIQNSNGSYSVSGNLDVGFDGDIAGSILKMEIASANNWKLKNLNNSIDYKYDNSYDAYYLLMNDDMYVSSDAFDEGKEVPIRLYGTTYSIADGKYSDAISFDYGIVSFGSCVKTNYDGMSEVVVFMEGNKLLYSYDGISSGVTYKVNTREVVKGEVYDRTYETEINRDGFRITTDFYSEFNCEVRTASSATINGKTFYVFEITTVPGVYDDIYEIDSAEILSITM